MRTLLASFGSVLLVVVVMWSVTALIPACGAGNRIAPTWLEWCPVNNAEQVEFKLAELTDTNLDLRSKVLERERELALLQCEPKVPVQTAIPEQPVWPPKIDEQEWNDRQIGLLEGCWDLDSRFVTNNRQTGVQTRYNVWTMCFDANGVGREEMQSDNGNSCTGPVTGAFDVNGNLIIEEPGNLRCSDGGYIYRLRSSCTLNANGTASCVVTQPEVGSSTTVEFRRSVRGN